MSNLVEIRNNQVVVSSRQVAESFGKEHKNVLRLLSSKMSGANKDKLSQHFYKDTYKDSTGKSNTIYYMDRDGFSFLVMGFTGEKADKWKLDFIEAFNTMEKQLQTQKQLPNFNDPVASARAWADAMESKQKALAQLEETKPLVTFANTVQASHDCILIRELAKLIKQRGINIGEKRLFKWLRENNYLIKANNDDYNKPTQKAMNLGLFEVNEQTYKTAFGVRISTTSLVTPKGQLYFINKFIKQ